MTKHFKYSVTIKLTDGKTRNIHGDDWSMIGANLRIFAGRIVELGPVVERLEVDKSYNKGL